MLTNILSPGVYVPAPTFFHVQPEGSSLQPAIDIPTQVAHSVHLAKSGITGLVLMGSTGEAIHLSRDERSELIRGVREGLDDAGFPKSPIISGVLVNSINETLEWLEDAERAGSQFGLVLAPGYFGGMVSQRNLIEWYTIVADKSPIPILIYHYPGVTNNVVFAVETYVQLAKHPNIVGCKMSHGNVSHHLQVSLNPHIDHTKFHVFSGLGQQLGPIVMFGASGVVDGLAGIFPKTVVRLYNIVSHHQPDANLLEEAYRLQWLVATAEEFVGGRGILGVREAIYKTLGFGNMSGGRLPLRGTLAEEGQANWSDILDVIRQEEDRL